MTSIEVLSEIIRNGVPSGNLNEASTIWRQTLDSLFGDRYFSTSPREKRVALIPDEEKVSFAGLIHPENPNSGAYSGMCLVWFPIKNEETGENKSLLAFGCGTRGLGNDEIILSRPGHSRYLHALSKYIQEKTGCFCWCKQDPANVTDNIPEIIKEKFLDFKEVFSRYGNVLYFFCEVPQDINKSEFIVKCFFDYYSVERGWNPLHNSRQDVNGLIKEIQKRIFDQTDEDEILRLLRKRLYVILQGAPGTGKTRLAQNLRARFFSKNSKSIQFHPTTTYENFIAGIQPNVLAKDLLFEIVPGFLVEALEDKKDNVEYLLVIDEINRADLSKVLGESIALFEYREVLEQKNRSIELPYKTLKTHELSLPKDFYLLGTMNTADRSIANMDLAVRRRFAFVNLWPQSEVVEKQNIPLASDAFSKLLHIFIQYATDDNLILMPGHSYFLADDTHELINRFKFELIPLLREYMIDGRISSMNSQIQGYIDWLDNLLFQKA